MTAWLSELSDFSCTISFFEDVQRQVAARLPGMKAALRADLLTI